jgi:hypothetical protein
MARTFRLKLILAAVSLCCVSKLSGAQLIQRSDSGTQEFSITGVVINSDTAEPVRGALVQVEGFATLTDERGRFNFDHVPNMTARISAEKPGYFGEQQIAGNLHPNRMIDIAAGLQPITIKLIPEGVITGQVKSEDGEPLENIPVALTGSLIQNGLKTWQQRGGVQTDDEGRFRIPSLQPGTYYLSAGPGQSPGVNTTSSPGARQGYTFSDYPSGQELSAATPIVITPGKRVEADFVLSRKPFYRVSGSVSGYARGQNVGIQFFATSGSRTVGGAGADSQTGAFQSNFMPSGSYILRATSYDPRSNETFFARLSVNMNSDISNLHVSLAPSRTIPINCHVDWAHPPNTENSQPAMVQVSPADQDPANGTSWPNVPNVQMDGPPGQQKLVVRNLEPGRYRVQIRPNGPLYLVSATYGNVDLLRDDLVIGSGSTAQTIEIYLHDDPSVITGSVQFPGERSGAVVFVVPEEFPKLLQMTFTNRDGNFQVSGLAPGAYRIFALDNADSLEFRNPEALQNYLAAANLITVLAGQRASVAVGLIHREN